MAAAAAGAGVGLLGSVLGSAASSSVAGGANIAATAMTNKANKEIAQMNNDFNEKMLDKQISYNKEMYEQQVGDQWSFYNDAKQNQWDMFNATNEYNSASAQRERLEAAGLNPYMMMSGASAGSATSSSSPSAGSAPGAQGINPPTASPYSADYSGIGEALGGIIDRFSQAKAAGAKANQDNAAADNLKIEGKYKAAKMIAEIYSLRTNAKTNEERLALDKLIGSIDMDLKSAQVDETNERTGVYRTQARLMALEAIGKQTELNFLPQQLKMQLSGMAADIALKRQQSQLTKQQVETEIQKAAESIARQSNIQADTLNKNTQGQGMQLENEFNADTYKARVKTIKVSLQKMINEDLPYNFKDLFISRPTKQFDLFK